jgi:hypothetical protein
LSVGLLTARRTATRRLGFPGGLRGLAGLIAFTLGAGLLPRLLATGLVSL